jgi:hippurate hydrolase
MMSDAIFLGGLLGGLLMAAGGRAGESVDAMLDREMVGLIETYQKLHASPELSHHEEKTSALLADQLRASGYTVTERVGKFPRPEWTGYGVVAVMKNSEGPTVLVRTDMDALPVEEKTSLPYASKVRVKNDSGQEVAVMHACGHDLHMTSLLGTARLMARMKERWRGTLVLVGQPAEETIDGAAALLADGLYERFPRPDVALALHDNAELEAGKVGWSPGFALASSTSVDITVRGLGGHGSKPEATKDPIVVSAQIIMALQTIVSREISPLDPAVVTVGSIHGGTKRNIIPDQVELQLTVRAYKEEVRQKILASIERISVQTARAAGIPEDRAPIVRVSETEFAPATYNDPDLTQRLSKVLERTLGAENVVKWPPIMGSEDFGRLGLEGQKIPTCLFWLGAVDPGKAARSRETGSPLPSLHSGLFQPLPEPAIRAGVKAMTAVLMDLMTK